MKRKADKQAAAAPMSAVAARKARQQQAQTAAPPAKPSKPETSGEPPSKKARRTPEEEEENSVQAAGVDDRRQTRRSTRRKTEDSKAQSTPEKKAKAPAPKPTEQGPPPSASQDNENEGASEESDEEDAIVGENGIGSVQNDDDEYESPADTPALAQEEFPLSRTRLNKSNIVYSDEERLCVRIKDKMSLVLLGHYDLWVKRGVISLMGAKLHPSSRVYRVYAPSTHSLPVIKCVASVDGAAEIEVKSCHSGIYRLRDLSPLYQRVWNGKNTAADKLTLKKEPASTRRTFSVLYTSADDSLKRHLRPLHLEKQWSSAIKSLSQRGGRLKTLICGPKASGKSTFSRYLLNHLLSPAPQTETNYYNTDGVAFLDLDPGQPEFSPMGQVYLAHLRSPVFGPPFSHPSLDGSQTGTMVRAHHIGATSPKDDPDHYMLAAMDLMDRYRALLATYPQCSLIINYPGWIFGLGLEVATWLVRSLGLSDVVYMSEKGPTEVIEPLGQAAHEAMVPLTILPSQPTDFVSRSSAQLRTMQMQSYFHLNHADGISNPLWLDQPLSHTRPFRVSYAGPNQGIRGIMVMGSQIDPDLLHDVLDGALVGVVAVESPRAILGETDREQPTNGAPDAEDEEMENASHAGSDVNMDDDEAEPTTPKPQDHPSTTTTPSSIDANITRTRNEDLPYLFVGAGSCTPLDPRASHSLGLALVRSVDVPSRRLELVTPIAGSKIRQALEHGSGIVLVRGQLDNPNWAVSEEYHGARAAEKRHRESIDKARKIQSQGGEEKAAGGGLDPATRARVSAALRDRVRRASNVPWMTVVDDSRRQREAASQREKSLWKLRKKAYPGSESEGDW
ncbi:polynucleotide 5'-hydroxyl-kinase grc3 [Aspergillus steynii IBT 23096]|uniref:Polynucleotide 5'-hydroxyl-kinase GRC3 n=1 Tax=Aspergillus steynii IBT 23096 TaxID=1392250 RepID=A0A2I2FYY4_9EURO|nr:polynucleotide 5'-hydroxyl-kinase grc3 [Aspergillus steynii IBT 23096]PLB45756.1 polynucleotide 5'-hydroxyl-kinase grc3 [Aspergillus steynii IBT 23096]